MPPAEQFRVATLRGPDHLGLGVVAVEEVTPSLVLALSRGRFPKGYPHLDPNEDGALAATDGATSVLAVVDGHSGFDAARAALQATLDQVPALLAAGAEAAEEALRHCFATAGEAVVAAVEGLQGERAASATGLTVAVVGPGRLVVAGWGDGRGVVVRGARAKIVGSPSPFLGPHAEGSAPAVERRHLRPGDWVLVATDGLFEFLGRRWRRRLAALAEEGSAAAIARRAVEAAFTGGAGDNVAVVVAAVA